MSETGQRVILVKPGDTLIFGNVRGFVPDEVDSTVKTLQETLGIERIVIFEDDIDMDVLRATEASE